MPRKPSFPAYPKKPHSSGQARIKIQGRVYYLGPFGSDKSRQEYARLAAEFAAAPSVPPRTKGTATVAEIAARWLARAEAGDGPGVTEVRETRRALTVLVRLYGQARQIGVVELGVVRDAMISGSWWTAEERAARSPRNGPIQGWCRNVVNRQVTRIRTVWRWAEQQGLAAPGSWAHLCSLGPIARSNRRVRQTEPRQPAAREQVEAVLGRVPPTVAAMIELQWLTGMRPGEVVAIRVQDLDTSGEVWIYRPAEHKMSHRGQTRAVPLGPECQRIALPWLDAAKRRGPGAYLFPPHRRRWSESMTTAAYSRAIARACEELSVPHWAPYQLRHAAKLRITRECGLDAARAILGQISIGTTNLYAQGQDLRLASEAAKKTG